MHILTFDLYLSAWSPGLVAVVAASQAASQAASRAVSMASPFDQVEEEGRNGRNGQKLFDKIVFECLFWWCQFFVLMVFDDVSFFLFNTF